MSSKMLLNPKSREEAEQNESTLYEAFPISMYETKGIFTTFYH